MRVSVIIRMRNEVQHLRPTLDALLSQDFPDGFEVIVVDNCSTDGSLQVAREYTQHILTIDDYTPGKALNMAMEYASGDYIAILSAHTLPANDEWLSNFVAYMRLPHIGGVYGAQLYPLDSKFLDKRDLDLFSTMSPRVEVQDTDFWNANSMITRSAWQKQAFDEKTYELEDHYWTKLLTPQKYRFYFEPESLVYHYSHISRIDREHLPYSTDDAITQINKSMLVLEDPDSDWPSLMRAGLTLSSLTDVNHIHQATRSIGETLLRNADFDVRWRMAQALGKIQSKDSVEYLIQALGDPSFYPRDEAAWSLARLGETAISPLLNVMERLSPDERLFAALALGKSRVLRAEEEAIALFNDLLKTDDIGQLCNVLYFIGEVAGTYTSERLIQQLNHSLREIDDPRLTRICSWALGEYGRYFESYIDWEIIRELSSDSTDELTRFEAVVALGKRAVKLNNPRSLMPVIDRLKDPSSRVRFGTVQSIRRYVEVYPKADIPNYENLLSLQDSDNGVRYELSLIHAAQNRGGIVKCQTI